MQGGRREFLSSFALGLGSRPAAAQSSIPYRRLGRTGERVSLAGLGGYHIGSQKDEKESIRIIRTAIDNGINFMDNCWDYNGGASEARMGNALRHGYRRKVFLMSKIDGRDRKTAAAQIDESLNRLQTDHVDLMQFHEIIRMSDPDRIFAPGGGMEAMLEAQKAGKVRFIGFTGHKDPEIHLKMLQTAARNNFRFDTVQMPLNCFDIHFDSFERKVLPVLLKQQTGVLAMKPLGDGLLMKSNVVKAPEALRFAMSLPVSVVITGCDSIPVLEQALNVARGFRPMTRDDRAALLARTAAAAGKGRYELYKTAHDFDGTYHNPGWMGPNVPGETG